MTERFEILTDLRWPFPQSIRVLCRKRVLFHVRQYVMKTCLIHPICVRILPSLRTWAHTSSPSVINDVIIYRFFRCTISPPTVCPAFRLACELCAITLAFQAKCTSHIIIIGRRNRTPKVHSTLRTIRSDGFRPQPSDTSDDDDIDDTVPNTRIRERFSHSVIICMQAQHTSTLIRMSKPICASPYMGLEVDNMMGNCE